MDDTTIHDLKQFIAATVRQETFEIRQEISQLDSTLSKRIDDLGQQLNGKIDDLSGAVAEAISSNTEETDGRLNNHEKRIKLLEHKVAA